MKMMKLFGLCACFFLLVLSFCGKDKGTNPGGNLPGPVSDMSDTLALRAILDANNLTSISAGSPSIVTLTLINGNIRRIKELTLTNKGITTIPARIKDLTAMQILRLDSNSITALPPEIGRCTTLVRIQLSNNQLSTVPAEISSLHHLSALVLSHNSITSLPPSLWNTTSLEQLYLDYNQLTAIPAEVSNLTLLVMLALNNNALTALPSSLTDLTNLAILINNNLICASTLPSTFVGWLDNRAELGWQTTQGTCP
jgi:Leucine-rich repeat (LRR) protein